MAVLTRAEPAERRAPRPETRRIERRRSLPGGRAVVGGLLVGLAAVGTFAAWQAADGEPTTQYLLAARDVGIGERLTPDDLVLATMELGDATAAGAFDEAAAALAVGQLAVAPLAEGDLVQRSAIVVADDAEPRRQLSFPVDQARALAGTLERGEVIDVVVSYGDGTSAVAVSGAVVADLVGGEDFGGGVVVLVSVPGDADVVAIAGALQNGDVTLVRATGAPSLDADGTATVPVVGEDDGADTDSTGRGPGSTDTTTTIG